MRRKRTKGPERTRPDTKGGKPESNAGVDRADKEGEG